MKKRTAKIVVYLALALILAGGFFLLKPSWERGRAYDTKISESSEAIINDEAILYSYVRKFGPQKTIVQLHALSAKYGECHTAAHKAGRFAYEIYDAKAFQECSAECHSGCYHGATEAYFRKHGTANLSQNLKTLCSSELNPFFSHQCLHGVGHGLMAWTNYELYEALTNCELLTRGVDSCYTGVFMENIVGGLGNETADGDGGGHFTKYLNRDPHYPCDAVGEKYKAACYLLQTSRMVQLFGVDFKKVTEVCSQAPSAYRDICFQSMGRDVGGVYRHDPRRAVAECNHALKGADRSGCLMGAAQDFFWDATGQYEATHFCALLSDQNEKAACYSTIFGRAPQVIASRAELQNFCNNVETDFRRECESTVR